jgi:hypothetical protein
MASEKNLLGSLVLTLMFGTVLAGCETFGGSYGGGGYSSSSGYSSGSSSSTRIELYFYNYSSYPVELSGDVSYTIPAYSTYTATINSGGTVTYSYPEDKVSASESANIVEFRDK